MDIQQEAKVSRNSSIQNQSEEDMDVRRGPWTVEEDFTLINYIAHHGEGRWNSLARCAGLNRTGKSCRLRWLNYLRPDVRRGNITLEEQLLILELHSRWGNRWSKIAQHLPGRTDNEIKNYWRTRVQKHAKQLKCDVNSKQFKDTMRYLWMPRLLERIQASATTPAASSSTTTDSSVNYQNNINNLDMGSDQMMVPVPQPPPNINNNLASSVRLHTPDQTSSAAVSSDSFGTDHDHDQVSPVSELTDCYNYPVNEGNNHQDYYCYNYPAAASQSGYGGDQSLTTPNGYFNPGSGLDFQVMDQNINQWMAMDGGDVSGNLWNVDDMWFLQHQY